jgi:NADH-quinone oxidoreductase subunit N
MNPQILMDVKSIYPEIILTVTLLLVVVADLVLKKTRGTITFCVTASGLLSAMVAAANILSAPSRTLFFNTLASDPMAVFFKLFLVLTSLLVLIVVPRSRELSGVQLGEFYALLLGVTLATLMLASSTDFLMLYLSLETVSIGSYVLVGYLRNDRQSNEASLKYLLFGAVASGSMLYGITLIYGLTGTTKLIGIREILAGNFAAASNAPMLLIATVLVLAGFGFKTAAVPFHFWCPDVYTGAPTPVTAFLSVAPKAAGFATMLRVLFTGLAIPSAVEGHWTAFNFVDWRFLLLAISVITMTLGNLAALRQENMKRLLAYSSIAHAGYILMGVVVLTTQGMQAVLIYLITYLFMNLGAFLVIIEVYNSTGSFDIKDYRGLYRRSPFLTISMTIFLLSLMGIPPFAGFFGKFFIFGAAVRENLAWFAVIGALNSVIGVYYYARVIKTMIIEPGEETGRIRMAWSSRLMVWILLLPTAAAMLFWDQIQRLATTSANLFL